MCSPPSSSSQDHRLPRNLPMFDHLALRSAQQGSCPSTMSLRSHQNQRFLEDKSHCTQPASRLDLSRHELRRALASGSTRFVFYNVANLCTYLHSVQHCTVLCRHWRCRRRCHTFRASRALDNSLIDWRRLQAKSDQPNGG